jgi:purine-binding chemotaxis protein CheW
METSMKAGAPAQQHIVVAPHARSVEPMQSQYLTFMLSEEMFAISILGIKEIIEYDTLTVVPMMPECIRGVINLRGSVVPVIDLSARIGRRVSPVGKRTCIVIVEVGVTSERQDVGMIVDAINQVLEIPAADIEPVPQFGANIRTCFIEGMAKIGGRFLVILDINHILSMEQNDASAAVEPRAPAVPAYSADQLA